jgi:4-amino-4-deoxy-L-arabinose transferase-like glycosyltransferase
LIIPLIYLTVLLFEKNIKNKKLNLHPHTKFWASLVYALMVLPIQQSHFFTTDTFLNLFIFASFYFSLKYFFNKKFIYLIVAGIFLGLALASKITAIFILPLNIVLIILNYCWPISKELQKNKLQKIYA